MRDGLTELVDALQEEAAQQAEKDWATLDDAEKRIFEDIAKGELHLCPPQYAFYSHTCYR